MSCSFSRHSGESTLRQPIAVAGARSAFCLKQTGKQTNSQSVDCRQMKTAVWEMKDWGAIPRCRNEISTHRLCEPTSIVLAGWHLLNPEPAQLRTAAIASRAGRCAQVTCWAPLLMLNLLWLSWSTWMDKLYTVLSTYCITDISNADDGSWAWVSLQRTGLLQFHFPVPKARKNCSLLLWLAFFLQSSTLISQSLEQTVGSI